MRWTGSERPSQGLVVTENRSLFRFEGEGMGTGYDPLDVSRSISALKPSTPKIPEPPSAGPEKLKVYALSMEVIQKERSNNEMARLNTRSQGQNKCENSFKSVNKPANLRKYCNKKLIV